MATHDGAGGEAFSIIIVFVKIAKNAKPMTHQIFIHRITSRSIAACACQGWSRTRTSGVVPVSFPDVVPSCRPKNFTPTGTPALPVIDGCRYHVGQIPALVASARRQSGTTTVPSLDDPISPGTIVRRRPPRNKELRLRAIDLKNIVGGMTPERR